eukprot:TRINITY_DN1470_c0_g1_i1.p1 TRINITY_DN1470_c0_g1~~TRINITY_DN1470_c0_g1_i1.p1  ORF type:complete len:235 (-),score=52.12 TRINITY_DN1470_c0_g1_i1:340-1044(-)
MFFHLIYFYVFVCYYSYGYYVISFLLCFTFCLFFFFQAEDGIRDLVPSRGLGDVYKRQLEDRIVTIFRTFPTTTTVGEVVGMQVRETDCMGTALTLVGRETSSVKAALLELQTSLHAAAAAPTRAPVMTLLQKLHTSLLSPMSISPPGEYYKQVMHRLVKPGAMPKAPTKAVAEVKASCEEYIAEVKKAMDEILTADSLPTLKGPSIMEKAPEVCAQVFKAIADLEVALLSVTS